MPLSELARWFRTVRHLRASQVAWRSRYVLERRLRRRAAGALRFDAPRLPAECGAPLPEVPVGHRAGPRGGELLSAARRGEFCLLGQSRRLGLEPTDWLLGPCRQGRLWVVSLHYHDWAYGLAELAGAGSAEASALLARLLDDWLAHCHRAAPGALELAWNSYAVATRLAWWARLHAAWGADRFAGDPELAARWRHSFLEQAEFLHRHVEWDLRANHLLRDAVGLAWAGRFCRGGRADAWLRTATELAAAQIAEQVLADGGHFERSPMYHVQAMEDVLSLALLLQDSAAQAALRQAWIRMAEYLAWVRHPDGQIALLNDATLCGAVPPDEMLGRAGLLGATVDAAPRRGGRHFADTGLAVWHGEPWSLLFDVGPLGPDFQPGHGHADSLTLEASYQGRRLLVDPGTPHYDDDALRRRARGTAAHNTVTIDGRDSSEVWGMFRVGRRARPLAASCRASADSFRAAAAHDGYDFLPGAPRHERSVEVIDQRRLRIVDRLTGQRSHRCAGGWLIEPGWTVEPCPAGWRLTSADTVVRAHLAGSAPLALALESAEYSPRFGQTLSAPRLVWRYDGSLPLAVTTVLEAE